MRNLILAISAVGLLLIGAAGAQAGERHGGYNNGRHHQGQSYHSTPYWVGSIFFGHQDRGHRAYDRRYDRRYGHHRTHRHYGHKHHRYDGHRHYKKHKHRHKVHKRHILPINKIVRKLRHRKYHDISKIVLKHDRYKVRAYDRKGRPVRLVVNAHNGRILRKRYR